MLVNNQSVLATSLIRIGVLVQFGLDFGGLGVFYLIKFGNKVRPKVEISIKFLCGPKV